MKRLIILLAIISIILGTLVIRNIKRSESQYHENAEYVNSDDYYETVHDELKHLEESEDVVNNINKQNSNQYEGYYVIRSYKEYKITFACPNNWSIKERDSKDRDTDVLFSGVDGFLRIGMLEGKNTEFETLALNEVYQSGRPYGSTPKIFTARMNGLKGIFIIPSSDQDRKFEDKALCIIEYPKPLVINNREYKYLLLSSMKSKIGTIAKSVKVTE